MRRCNSSVLLQPTQQPALLLRSPGTRFIQVHQSTRNPACIAHIMLRGDPAGCCRGGRACPPPCPRCPPIPDRCFLEGPEMMHIEKTETVSENLSGGGGGGGRKSN